MKEVVEDNKMYASDSSGSAKNQGYESAVMPRVSMKMTGTNSANILVICPRQSNQQAEIMDASSS